MQESEPLRSSAEWTSTSHNRTGKITDRHFFSGIEGARGIAALMVLLYHVGVYSGQVCSTLWHQEGNGIVGAVLAKNEAGLPVFFVLSGALLYRPFASPPYPNHRIPRSGRICGAEFYEYFPPIGF